MSLTTLPPAKSSGNNYSGNDNTYNNISIAMCLDSVSVSRLMTASCEQVKVKHETGTVAQKLWWTELQ